MSSVVHPPSQIARTLLDLFVREWQPWKMPDAHSSQGYPMPEESAYGPAVPMLP